VQGVYEYIFLCMSRFSFTIAAACLIAPLGAKSACAFDWRSNKIDGPVSADIVRVIDGDTVEVTAYPWPQQSVDVLVRIRGVDAPEIHAKCDIERQGALRAKDRLSKFLSQPGHIYLTGISGDKYFGRVVADLGFANGDDAASMLILEHLARPYDGGKKQDDICLSNM